MNEKRLKVVLWIAFTALFFIIFCGVSYLINGRINPSTAVLFFVIIGVVDERGIGYLVDYYVEKAKSKQGDSAE